MGPEAAMAESPGIHLSRISQIAVTVKDVKRATAFYRDVFGLHLLFEAPGGGGGLSFFDAGGVRLMLATAPSPEFDHPASILFFDVDDIARAHEELVSRGVVFVEKPHMIARLPDRDVWIASMRDSEENVMALMSEPRRAE
ncbi:MAG: VOC family protein [Thermoanaerobaculia bacterium]